MDKQKTRYYHPTQKYHGLAKQVSQIRWFVPPTLFAFVFIFEFSEHTLVHNSPLDTDFFLELLLFGILGPTLIALILTWIVGNLHQLEMAYDAIDRMNNELEQKSDVAYARISACQ